MRKVTGPLIALLAAAAMIACAPVSRACDGNLEVQDRLLLETIMSSLSERAIVKVADENASTERKYIGNALRRTFAKDVVALAVNHSCAVFANGENRFSIHVLQYADQPAANAAASLVGQRKANTLKIQALTYYSFLQVGTTLVFFVADRQSYQVNQPVFDAIRARYQPQERQGNGS